MKIDIPENAWHRIERAALRRGQTPDEFASGVANRYYELTDEQFDYLCCFADAMLDRCERSQTWVKHIVTLLQNLRT